MDGGLLMLKEATEVVMEPNFYIGLMVDTIP
nr:MAG TPA: hypothetical protein [Caudoviricetes sp.]